MNTFFDHKTLLILVSLPKLEVSASKKIFLNKVTRIIGGRLWMRSQVNTIPCWFEVVKVLACFRFSQHSGWHFTTATLSTNSSHDQNTPSVKFSKGNALQPLFASATSQPTLSTTSRSFVSRPRWLLSNRKKIIFQDSASFAFDSIYLFLFHFIKLIFNEQVIALCAGLVAL